MSRSAETGTSTGTSTQEYYHGHNDDVLCMAVSGCRRFVATGQTASLDSHGKGSICIWGT